MWMPNQPKWPHVIFRADPDKKKRAMRKAELQGTNLSEVMRLKLDEFLYDGEYPFPDSLPDEDFEDDDEHEEPEEPDA